MHIYSVPHITTITTYIGMYMYKSRLPTPRGTVVIGLPIVFCYLTLPCCLNKLLLAAVNAWCYVCMYVLLAAVTRFVPALHRLKISQIVKPWYEYHTGISHFWKKNCELSVFHPVITKYLNCGLC